MSIIKSKQDLEAAIQTLFPDNTSGAITAAKLREYLQENLDSTTLQRVVTVYFTTASETMVDADIDDNIRYFAMAPTHQVIALPEITPAIETLTINIVSITGNGVTFTSTSPITGDVSASEAGLYTLLATFEGWVVSFAPIARPDNRSLTFSLGNNNDLADGAYLSFAGVQLATASIGILAPFDLTIVKYSLSRSDTDISSLKFYVDGALVDSTVTNSLRATGDLLITWPEGTLLRIQNSGNPIYNPLLNLVAEYTL
jgi:hypothetical protein